MVDVSVCVRTPRTHHIQLIVLVPLPFSLFRSCSLPRSVFCASLHSYLLCTHSSCALVRWRFKSSLASVLEETLSFILCSTHTHTDRIRLCVGVDSMCETINDCVIVYAQVESGWNARTSRWLRFLSADLNFLKEYCEFIWGWRWDYCENVMVNLLKFELCIFLVKSNEVTMQNWHWMRIVSNPAWPARQSIVNIIDLIINFAIAWKIDC